MNDVQTLKAAHQLIEAGQQEHALPLIYDVLHDDPDNGAAQYMLGYLYLLSERHALAYGVYKLLSIQQPHRPAVWNNLGLSLQEMHRYDEALESFRKALEVDPGYAPGYNNIATTLICLGRYEDAVPWAQEALKLDPKHKNAWTNLGFANLAMQNWREGFDGFANALGGKYRQDWTYGDAPKWEGQLGETVVVYGEQGIGDEIMASQMLLDAQRDCKRLIYDCHPRLEGLFRRSFPGVEIHGTRKQAEVDWLDGVDYRCALFDLGRFYRRQDAEFPRHAYLQADSERVLQWRSLFDSWGKPVIGIAWGGGTYATQTHLRHVGLEAFRPLIEGTDAIFVALEYKDAADEIASSGLPVRWYPRATMAEDYDETAGLVAACDEIIGAHTSALHLAAALGKRVTCLIPSIAQWRYYRDDMPWYPHMRLFRQQADEPWASTLHRLAVERGVASPVEVRIDIDVRDGTAAGERAQELLDRVAGVQNPEIAEIGVYKGDMSSRVLRRQDVRMTLIDPWSSDEASDDYKATADLIPRLSPDEWDDVMQTMANAVSFAGERVRIVKATSLAARPYIGEKTFDAVFIDGDHSYSGCAADIALWWDAVKPGGWFGGHDYRTDKAGFGVVQAVDEFVSREGVKLHLGRNTTWWVRKP